MPEPLCVRAAFERESDRYHEVGQATSGTLAMQVTLETVGTAASGRTTAHGAPTRHTGHRVTKLRGLGEHQTLHFAPAVARQAAA
ncbi:MAG TPA: hypothetical protein VN767_12240 [Streptosporangiaceae bacterium]|nr:hypothetical protein [Streptosporangiaceae bacterium]